MKIRILPEARADIIDAFWFYEESEPGLGSYFVNSISEDIDSLLVTAGVHSLHFDKHKKVATKFPFSIFYLIEKDEIRIYAVLDDRRDPEWISERLN